jgi:hypothetical protein
LIALLLAATTMHQHHFTNAPVKQKKNPQTQSILFFNNVSAQHVPAVSDSLSLAQPQLWFQRMIAWLDRPSRTGAPPRTCYVILHLAGELEPAHPKTQTPHGDLSNCYYILACGRFVASRGNMDGASPLQQNSGKRSLMQTT